MNPNCIFFMDRGIRGITALGKEIFVIHYNQSHVSVYDPDTLKASRYIDIPDITSPFGLSGCFYNKALYISDQGLKSIHRVDLINDSVSRWKMRENHEPRDLSVTAKHRLLVTVGYCGLLWNTGNSGVVEYTSQGEQVLEIRFDESINQAWQTVQLSNDQLIICHGSSDSLHRVCRINTEGEIIKSHGGEKGGGLSLLNHPYSMAIHDNSKHLFVADHINNRILLLDTDLTYLSRIYTPPEFRWPSHLYFDSLTGWLLVDSKESLLSSRCTAKIIEHKGQIRGVTVVNDEIFVVVKQQSHVDVYDSHSLTATRSIDVPDMTSSQHIASCPYNNVLYLCDGGLKCIHRVDLTSNSVTRWKMIEKHKSRLLSVTAEHTLLVTVRIRDASGVCSGVVEYTSEGQPVREIWFDERIKFARQTIQLFNDQYIVCYGHDSTSLHGICVINTEGQIIKSYSGDRETDEGSLYTSLATDAISKHVFVADYNSNRVLMLDTDLNYLGQVHTRSRFERPNCLYFDSSSDRLFLVEFTGGVVVISPPD